MTIRLNAREIIVAVAIAIAGGVIYLYATPVYLVRIELSQSQPFGLQFTCNEHVVELDGNGVAYMNICVVFDNHVPSNVRFEVQSSKDPTWFPHDFTVTSNGFLFGVVQLGDPKNRLHQDEDYAYRMTALDDNRSLSYGKIRATVRPVAGHDPMIIAVLGMSASVLQILSVLFSSVHGRSRNGGIR